MVLGNPNCRFDARSPYLRCAVKPDGPCEGCDEFAEIDKVRLQSLTKETIALSLREIDREEDGCLFLDLGKDSEVDVLNFVQTNFAFLVEGHALTDGKYFRPTAISVRRDRALLWIEEIDEKIEEGDNYKHWLNTIEILSSLPTKTAEESILLIKLRGKVKKYEEIQKELRNSFLGRTKPGARPGEALLVVDLSIAGEVDQVLEKLKGLGYSPDIRHVSYANGVHVLAVLREGKGRNEELMMEWLNLNKKFPSESVHQKKRV